ncbi:MAG: hypothetical protein LM558_04260 [Thermosphaera sp.]|nr:hypothetical protein [Thermosphaera sp.]
MSIQSLVDMIVSKGYQVQGVGNKLRVLHHLLPIYLDIVFSGSKVVVKLSFDNSLREFIEDLVSSGNEDVGDLIEDVIGEFNELAASLYKWFKGNGFEINIKLKEGEIDIMELLEDILEITEDRYCLSIACSGLTEYEG